MNYLKFKILLGFFLITIISFGQEGFEKISETDGVVFYGKWKPVKKSKKESPLVLCVIAHNTNTYSVDCNIIITFFDTGIVKEESEPIIFNIKPNKKAKGKKKGLCLLSANMTNESLTSDSFSYEIINPKITKTDKVK
jgi:hypothetical protein